MAGTFSNPSLLRRPLLPAWPPPVPTFGVQPCPLCPPRSSLRLLHHEIHFLPDREPAHCLCWSRGRSLGSAKHLLCAPGLTSIITISRVQGLFLRKALASDKPRNQLFH